MLNLKSLTKATSLCPDMYIAPSLIAAVLTSPRLITLMVPPGGSTVGSTAAVVGTLPRSRPRISSRSLTLRPTPRSLEVVWSTRASLLMLPPRTTVSMVRVNVSRAIGLQRLTRWLPPSSVPTALLMSIGMQESGCKRSAVGARGEQGIMQVAGNACDNPSGDCQEPWYNIHKGASILVDKMGGNPDGNIVSALGQYNGWMVSLLRAHHRGMNLSDLCSCYCSLSVARHGESRDPRHSRIA